MSGQFRDREEKVNANSYSSGVRRANVLIVEVRKTMRESRLLERKTLLLFVVPKWLLLSHLLTLFSFSLDSKYLLYGQERKKGRRKFKKYREIDGFAHQGVLREI